MKPALWLAAALAAFAQVPIESYRVENVPLPRDIAPEVAGVDFGPDGRLAVTFRRGYLYLLDTKSGRWSRFAEGLQSPLGVMAGSKPGEYYVAHLPELTRVVDTDNDGKADLFETIADGWGISGNYHEFLYGPVRDKQGNFYLSLGLSSNGAEPRMPVRGEFTARGRQAKEQKEGIVGKVGHYSPTTYRGCALKITPQGAVELLSCGFRQPNGLGFNAAGDLFATDNQGDWVGTSPLHHVTPGAFHGHPASLNWAPWFQGRDPVETPVDELDRLRKLPAIQFPQNDMGGSVTQPLLDTTAGAFGPYAGQMLVAEWTYPRILRADLEIIDGQYQGAAFIFYEGNGLRAGNNRIAISPDGKSLYTAQTSRIWGTSEGLQRIVYTGKPPMDILHMRLLKDGFELEFTHPVDPATARDPAAYGLTSYFYKYHSVYGSPKTDIQPERVTSVELSSDGRKARLTVPNLRPRRIYELRPSGIRAATGTPLCTVEAAYTLNKLRP
jgi:glucose/arabinose dehydrogenase